MSDIGAGPPEPREQIAGLTFALLLLKPDLSIDQVNPATESLIGRSARRLLGRKFLDVVSFAEGRIGERLIGGEAQTVARGLAMEVDRRQLVVNMTISPMAAHPGWRVVTLSDAGQEERLGEEERAPLRGPAVLAHEIKNPLSAIRGAAQLVARKLGNGDRALTDLITDEVDRIAQLIDRMQRLGREQPEPVAPLNLHAAVRRACDTVNAGADDEIPLREEFDPSLPPVLANEGALVQVLINLIANARDACQGGRKAPEIVVRTRFVSGLARNVMRLGRPVKLPIEVQVSDNGPGIDPALRDHIFEPFVSSKKNGQGLGLALVNKLMRDMDGRISHERDEAGGWTHFRVHLPMAK